MSYLWRNQARTSWLDTWSSGLHQKRPCRCQWAGMAATTATPAPRDKARSNGFHLIVRTLRQRYSL